MACIWTIFLEENKRTLTVIGFGETSVETGVNVIFLVHIMLFQFKSKIILNADSWGYLKPNELESWRMKPINLSFR